jgi:hypothetical protein
MKKYFPVWVWPVLFLFSVGTIWLRLWMIGTTYEINQMNQSIKNVQEQSEQSRLRLTRFQSPQQLQALAKKKFKLQSPQSKQIIHLRTQ